VTILLLFDNFRYTLRLPTEKEKETKVSFTENKECFTENK
jgi:hypothetical protein